MALLAGDDIGVNTHAHGEDDTRNAGDRQRAAGHEAEPARNCCQHAGNLSDQGDGSNHTQQAVQNDHVDDDACQRDDASDDHGVQRTLAHGRGDGLEACGFQRERQCAGVDLVC